MEKDDTKEKAQQHEDIALKTSVQFFAQELLPYWGIKEKVVGIAPTELVQIELHRQTQEFDLVMEDGSWIHFEFQSTNEGINTYRVHPIIMQNQNADEILQNLEEKLTSGSIITKVDLVPLVLCLLMGGKTSLKDRVQRSLKITRASENVAKEDIDRIETVIYAMADKFWGKIEIEEVWEMMKMTTLGEVLMREGRNEGRIEGRIEGKIKAYWECGLTLEDISKKLDMSIDQIKAHLNDE